MRKVISILALTYFALSFAACSNPQCNNTNPIFDKYPSESEQYKNELAKQLQADSTIKYYLDSYEEAGNNHYLHITVQNDSICAEAAVWVINSDSKLDGIIKNKGNGYGGAELIGLQIGTAPDTKKIQFVYKGLDKIID